MKNNCDILVTYCWNRVGYGILRSLYSKGLNVVVADSSKSNICSLSKYARASVVYTDFNLDETAFIQDLILIIAKYNPRILLPTHDEGVIIAKYRHLLPDNLIIPIPGYEVLMTISDKSKATEIAKSVGVPIPEVYNFQDVIQKFPIVFKTKIGNSAKGVYFPKDVTQLNKLKAKYAEKDVLLQEYVVGIDHSVDCIRYGDYFYATVYKAIVTKTHGGGTSTQRVIVQIPELCTYAHRILDKIDYNGVCGMDFKYDEDSKRCAFIEVNARYTGGVATPIAAGFDIPALHIDLALGSRVDLPKVKIGTKTKWILGDMITLVERMVTLTLSWKDLKSIFNFKFDAFDDFDKHDKKAFWGECKYYLSKFWNSKKLNP